MAKLRFRPAQHLHRPREIRAVREQGRRIDCRAFTFWWKHRETPPAVTVGVAPADIPSADATVGARMCVIASTAAVGGATRRNRAKRRLREVFRHQQALVPATCDLLLIARAAAVDCPLPDLKRKFSEACRQIPPASAKS